MLNKIDKDILREVADLHEIPQGAYSIRKDGAGHSLKSTNNIIITKKQDKEGIDILVKPDTKNESVHIPVIVSKEGISEMVYNTFEIGQNSDVLIVAGCGIHNGGEEKSEHNGVHEFFVRAGAKMKYVEKHYATGNEMAKKEFNPNSIIHVEDNATVELELVQIGGVTYTDRKTKVILGNNSKLIVLERVLTEKDQRADSRIDIELRGKDSSAQIVSRSVARDDSIQDFKFNMSGYDKCRGHIECDAIIMDNAKAIALPAISAYSSDANLIHEAAIGKIESEQITKLMTLGLAKEEAENVILKGFLK